MNPIHVFASRPGLRDALVSHIGQFGCAVAVREVSKLEALEAGARVICPTSDLSLELCRNVAGQGLNVFVLSTFPSDRERMAYLMAGAAAYIPMVVNLDHLQSALSTL